MMKIIVIGGGIVGTSTAFRLAQGGATVTLLEARALASGTSSTSFAWMNSNNKAPLEYHRLNVAGMTEHTMLAEELGAAPWLHVDGNAIWEDPVGGSGPNEPAVPVRGEPLDQKIRRLREWNYPVEILTRAELASIHPELKPQDEVERIAYFPQEGYVDVPRIVATLAHAARSYGADIQTGQEVIEVVQEAGRVVGIRTASGDRFPADMVVSCTGRWTDQVTALTGTAIPMAPTLGLLAVSKPVPAALRSLAHSTAVNVRPDGGSRVMMASFEHDVRLDRETSQETLWAYAHEILERAVVILPALAGSDVESIRLGIRAIPSDSFPAVGTMPGLDGFYVVATHSGVTMGPFLGRIVARELLTGELDDRLAGFRPGRLLASAGKPTELTM